MPDFLTNISPSVPLVLVILALLGVRWRVTPKASLYIDAPPERVFPLVDFIEGDVQRWQRTKVNCQLEDAATRTYRLTFVTPLATGAVNTSSAMFRVLKREAPNLIEVERAGLEGQSLNSQLLGMSASLAPEGKGTRLRMSYAWGPRPVLNQILARTDLWGSAYRLKGLAETGVPDYRTDTQISILVALVTGLISLGAFAMIFSLWFAGVLVAALFIHEFGHLLAYRLIGHPWGRMLFLPFLGAVAVPRLHFSTQGQSVFSALMGPGFSLLVPAICLFPALEGSGDMQRLALMLGLITTALNVFNLLPVEPLDGGVALRSVFTRLLGQYARLGMMFTGMLIVGMGFLLHSALFVVFGAVAIFANLGKRSFDVGLQPMSTLQLAITISGYTVLAIAYLIFYEVYVTHASLG